MGSVDLPYAYGAVGTRLGAAHGNKMASQPRRVLRVGKGSLNAIMRLHQIPAHRGPQVVNWNI